MNQQIKRLNANQLPKGAIIIWSGINIPEGFALCDGKNGTPDLKNKFIIGSGGNYKIGNTEGNEKIVLDIEQLPFHHHDISALIARNLKRRPSGSYPLTGTNIHYSDQKIYSTGDVGNGKEIDIMPPFYALAYIMKK